ncbi:MAG: LysM peptidoglycan-binding domain-containing protein [Thermodesulfovibrionales bacterium]
MEVRINIRFVIPIGDFKKILTNFTTIDKIKVNKAEGIQLERDIMLIKERVMREILLIIFLTVMPVAVAGAQSPDEKQQSPQEAVQEPQQIEEQKGTVIETETEEGFRIYTVQKGDTLWDITHNILKEPFLWPKVWGANPDIKNPDLIYPGQRIRIPLSVLRPELVKKEAEIKPEEVEALKEKEAEARVAPEVSIEITEEKKPDYLIDRNLLMASGYISKIVPDEGSIIGTPQGRTTAGKGDYIYIKTKEEARIGDKFYCIKPAAKIKHPDSGEILGYLIEINGVIEVIGEESGMTKAEIKESFKEINIGDRIDKFYLIEPPLKTEAPDIPKLKGTIVAIRHLYTTTGSVYDIVYIDRGSRDGVTQGSLMHIFSREKPVVSLGTLQVINVKEETSTAVVRKGLKEIVVGDRIINE